MTALITNNKRSMKSKEIIFYKNKLPPLTFNNFVFLPKVSQAICLSLGWVTICISFHHLYRDNQKVIICLRFGLNSVQRDAMDKHYERCNTKPHILYQYNMSMTLYWVQSSLRILDNLHITTTHLGICLNIGCKS